MSNFFNSAANDDPSSRITPLDLGPVTELNDHLTHRTNTIDVLLDKTNPARNAKLTYDLYYITGDHGIPHLVEWLKGRKSYMFDLETSGLDPFVDEIATMQLGSVKGGDPRAYVVDVRTCSRAALQPVFDTLTSYDVTKLGQNIRFECRFMQTKFGVRMRRVADTAVAEQIIRTGLFQSKAMRTGGRAGDKAAYTFSSMGWLAKFYLGLDLDKDVDLRTSFHSTAPGGHNDRQIAYAAGDVIYPHYIAERQAEEIHKRDLRGVIKVEFEVIPVLADAEVTGLYIDQPQWRALYQESLTALHAAESTLDEMMRPFCGIGDLFEVHEAYPRPRHPLTNKPLNYNSPEVVQWVIRTYCGSLKLPREIVSTNQRLYQLKKRYGKDWLTKAQERELRKKERGEKFKVLTERDIPDHVIPESEYTLLLNTEKPTLILRMVRNQLPAKLVNALIEYSKHQKRTSSFGIAFLNKYVKEDGRVHTEIHQAVTNTGRTSTQPNVQNVPSDQRWRHCFKPGKGRKLVIADYSQIEPRLSAQVSRDAVYMTAFLSKSDLYVQVAKEMFQREVDPTTKEGKLLRQLAKAIVLGLAYRMGPWKLRDQITIALAKDIMDGTVELPTIGYITDLYNKFFNACTGIREYQDYTSGLADPEVTTRPKLWDSFLNEAVTWIEAPCGRKRFFPPEAKKVFTEAPNAPIQGCSATITKAAAAIFQKRLDEKGYTERAHVVNLIHDEIVAEVEEEIADECAQMLQSAMEEAGQFYLPDVPVIAEFPKGTNGVVDVWTKEAA